jgi:hypothetical protein
MRFSFAMATHGSLMALSVAMGLIGAGAGTARAGQLLGWYQFENSSDLGLDSSGSGNNGTVRDFNGGGPTFQAGGYGGSAGAASFHGISDNPNWAGWTQGGEIRLPFNTGPDLWPNLTWGVWVKPNMGYVDNIRQIFDNDDGGYDRALGIDNRAGGNYSAFVNNGPYPYNSGVAPTAQWTFVAGVYENNYYGIGQGRLTMYVGGQVFEDIRTYYGSTGWTYTSLGSSPTFGEFWNGLMDNVFIFEGAATQSQMAQIQANPNAIPTIAAYAGVPEIDPTGIGSVLSFVLGSLGLLERRRLKAA